MTVSSSEFERQIKRIHEIIEKPGSNVTWNDHLPDPDNPNQSRQIDISVKKDDSLTLIECRHHQKKQDVKWIEELIGRRISLRANSIIAVSASGFTDGAIAKARAHGIFLRDLMVLTEDEIQSWGYRTKVYLNFLQFYNLKITIILSMSAKGTVLIGDIVRELLKQNLLYLIFDKLSKSIDEKKLAKQIGRLEGTVELPKNYLLLSHLVKKINLKSQVSIVTHEMMTPAILTYDDPAIPTTERDIKIESVALGHTHITQAQTLNKASLAVDLSAIKCPINSCFLHLTMDMNRIVTAKIEIIGLKPPPISLEKIQFILTYE